MGIYPIRAIRVSSFLAGLRAATLAYGEARVRAVPLPPPVATPPQPVAPIDLADEAARLRSALSEECRI